MKGNKIITDLLARGSVSRDELKKLNLLEDNWHKVLESNDQINIDDFKIAVKDDIGVALNIIAKNTASTIRDAAGYIREHFDSEKELTPSVLSLNSEKEKLKEIEYYKYQDIPIDSILSSLKETAASLASGTLNIIKILKDSGSMLRDPAVFEEMKAKFEELQSLTKECILFNPKAIDKRSLDGVYIYAGDAVIKQNKDKINYHEFMVIAKSIPEKLEIIAKRLDTPEFSSDLYEMSENCRDLHRKAVMFLDCLSGCILTMSLNLKKVKDTIEEDYDSLNVSLSLMC